MTMVHQPIETTDIIEHENVVRWGPCQNRGIRQIRVRGMPVRRAAALDSK